MSFIDVYLRGGAVGGLGYSSELTGIFAISLFNTDVFGNALFGKKNLLEMLLIHLNVLAKATAHY